VASASFAQATVSFDVVFDTLYVAAGSPVPDLTQYDTDTPFDLTGTVTITTASASTQVVGTSTNNNIVLNGSWNTEFAFNPPNTRQTFTYEDAVFDLSGFPDSWVANEFFDDYPQPFFSGTSIDGVLADWGPASLYGGTCPFTDFSTNCQSANPFQDFPEGLPVWDAAAGGGLGAPLLPEYADAGFHALVSGTATATDIGTPSLSHDNGLDGIYFDTNLCAGGDLALCGGLPVAEGIVRIVMTSASGQSMYVVEGTIAGNVVPVPAAVWLFGSALGLLAWVRRRVSA
jgi:hypothetical protein